MSARLTRNVSAIASLLVFAIITGCSGGSDTPTTPGATTGSMSITVTGLPTGINPSIVVSGPGGYSNTVTAPVTLSSLVPGAYTLTAPRAKDVGIDYAADVAQASVTAGSQANSTVAYSIRILARSPTNRTDESSALKFKLMYVLPSDGTDRSLDTNGTITKEVSSWNRWLATQAGGRYLRLDTSDGGIDIEFAKVSRTDAVMTSYGTFVRDTLEAELKRGGFIPANTFVIAYYEGGNSTACASAAIPPGLPGQLGAVFLKGLATSSFPCASNAFAASPTAAPQYLQFVALHETLHLLGIVSATAPNYVSSHVGNSPTDLMYAGSLPWAPSVLDFSKTNYYNAAGLPAGIVNLAQSAGLVIP